MLQAIKIGHFKSYQNQILPLAPLTLLIGANASGKTNVLEAFRFLSWLAEGQKLSVLQHAVNQSDRIIRGNVRELFYPDTASFELGCVLHDGEWNELSVQIALRNGELHIVQERIDSPQKSVPLYEIKEQSSGNGNDVKVAYNNFARGGIKPQITCTDQIAIMNQLASSALFASGEKKAQKTIPQVTTQFQKALSQTLFLDPVPSLMRNDSYPSKRLESNCANLAGVLYELWQNEAHRNGILDFICSLPEQNIQNIDFHRDHRGQVSLQLLEQFGKQQRLISSELLSDGTLRVLAIAAALLSSEKNTVIVIEEVDNGIHPSRVQKLLETMQKQAQIRGISLLLSTHNPALMNALPDAHLGDVVFCYRDSENGQSCLVRLSDLSNYVDLTLQGSLGDLVTQGTVDRWVKSPITPEEKKQKMLAWLARMKQEQEQ